MSIISSQGEGRDLGCDLMFQASPVRELLRAVLCLEQPVWLAGSVSGGVCEPQALCSREPQAPELLEVVVM